MNRFYRLRGINHITTKIIFTEVLNGQIRTSLVQIGNRKSVMLVRNFAWIIASYINLLEAPLETGRCQACR
jgi:hypothetical protein